MGIILAVLVFGTIIFVHELGHFLLAKVNGIRVDEFSLGMGPRLLSKVKGETRYSLKLFPIGGSCMMGEDDVNDVGEGSFNSKSVWARISVVAAGAIFNFILAFVFAVIIIAYTGYDEPVISDVLPGYSAQAEGMQAGDKILRMNNKKINIWREVTYYNQFHAGETIELVYERDGEKYEVTIVPKQDEEGSSCCRCGAHRSGRYHRTDVRRRYDESIVSDDHRDEPCRGCQAFFGILSLQWCACDPNRPWPRYCQR